MSSMNFLEKLLDGVEVEWKALKDIGSYVRGLVYNKSSESSDGQGYKVLRANNITLAENSLNFDDVKIVNFDTKVKKDQKLRYNDILISAASGSREHVGKVAFIEADIDYYFGGFMGVVRCNTSMIPRYAFHVLTSQHFKIYLDEMLNSSTINNLNSAVMGNFKFPIPCPENPKKSLEIQAEIVRILDAMTAHTAELTAELTARKKQYNYYRDKLLSFEDGEVEWQRLIDACDYVDYRGKTPVKTEKGVFLVTAKNIRMGYIDYAASEEFVSKEDYSVVMRRGLPKNGDILITTEAPCGFVAQVDRENIALAQRVIKYRSKNKKLSNNFIKHYLISSHFQNKLMNAATGSTVKGIKGSKLHQLTIPIPSEDEQARIVTILDKFDALTTSITEGLPREIELRQKQYAYYRDLLLSFPQAQAA